MPFLCQKPFNGSWFLSGRKLTSPACHLHFSSALPYLISHLSLYLCVKSHQIFMWSSTYTMLFPNSTTLGCFFRVWDNLSYWTPSLTLEDFLDPHRTPSLSSIKRKYCMLHKITDWRPTAWFWIPVAPCSSCMPLEKLYSFFKLQLSNLININSTCFIGLLWELNDIIQINKLLTLNLILSEHSAVPFLTYDFIYAAIASYFNMVFIYVKTICFYSWLLSLDFGTRTHDSYMSVLGTNTGAKYKEEVLYVFGELKRAGPNLNSDGHSQKTERGDGNSGCQRRLNFHITTL